MGKGDGGEAGSGEGGKGGLFDMEQHLWLSSLADLMTVGIKKTNRHFYLS